MTQHVRSRPRLVARHQVTRLVHQHEPQIARGLGPPPDFPVDGPLLLFGSLPGADALPVETIQVLHDPGSVDNKIVLAVVDEHSNVPEHDDDIRGIALGDIPMEALVDLIAARQVIQISGHSQSIFVIFDEIHKSLVDVFVLPEIEVVHPSEVLGLHVVVVGQKVKVIGCLAQEYSYVFEVLVQNVYDPLGLEPTDCVSELVAHDSHRVQQGVVVVELVGRVGPAIPNRHSRQLHLIRLHKRSVHQDSTSKGRYIVTGK